MKICHDCAKSSKPGYSRCQKCLDLHSAQERKYRKRDIEKYRIFMKRRGDERIDAGLCRSCGGLKDPDADEGYVDCVNCRLRLTRRI